jgi:hypothetical protein
VSGGVAVRPLQRVPAVEIGPAPDMDAADASRVEAERRRLDAHAAMVDGQILMVSAAAPDRLAVYPATYAWHTADRAAPLPGTYGALGVQLALVAEDGALLWQRRSDTVDHPGGWTISVAGTAVPGVAQVVFRAGLAPSARIVPRPDEVAEIRLAAAYPAEGPSESITAAWWPELVRLAIGEG